MHLTITLSWTGTVHLVAHYQTQTSVDPHFASPVTARAERAALMLMSITPTRSAHGAVRSRRPANIRAPHASAGLHRQGSQRHRCGVDPPHLFGDWSAASDSAPSRPLPSVRLLHDVARDGHCWGTQWSAFLGKPKSGQEWESTRGQVPAHEL